MYKVSSSVIAMGTVAVDYGPFRGPTGATGPRGPTGPTGPTGATGATGIGIFAFFPGQHPDGITIYLDDSSEIFLSGLSGNTFTDFYNAAYLFGIAGTSGTILNESFNIKGSVTGLTATFKPIIGLNGMSLTYTGNDLKFAVTIPTGAAIGVSGSALRSAGKTAGTFDSSIFKYQENTVGITTVNIAKIKVTQFAQANTQYNKNVQTIFSSASSVLTSTDGRKNTSFYQINPDGATVSTDVYYSTEWSKINNNNVAAGLTLQFRDQLVFNNLVPYSMELGSCCFCDGTDLKRCIDYVNSLYCTSLNGVFSYNYSCEQRKLTDCKSTGACCYTGSCANTDADTCSRIIGATFYPKLSCAAGNSCPR
jgi:hypothetical protein